MTLEYFTYSGVALLLFLPGVLLLHIYLTSKRRVLPLADLVLAGGVLWNFLFFVPSLVLGLFTPYVLGFFSVFLVLSLGMVFIWLINIWKNARVPKKKNVLNHHNFHSDHLRSTVLKGEIL